MQNEEHYNDIRIIKADLHLDDDMRCILAVSDFRIKKKRFFFTPGYYISGGGSVSYGGVANLFAH